ncbi:MAG TPA: pilus assembly PilX N-terminal domain-containing protein [Candidatus Angelobacter sp.]|nr:pilus assembly PilX N-terminal domain-containing protein [Candidatus Angelobacter sp.]
MATSGKTREKGFALIAVLLFLVLLSAMAVTLAYTVRTDKRIGGSDQEGNIAYYDAEAGMEKMTADLGALFVKTKSPTAQMITDLGNDKPGLPDVGYNYVYNVQANADGSPVSHVQTISAGDFAGLSAQIIPINLDVTATRVTGAQAHLTRDVEVAQIPVFQFGVFSDSDLSYFAGPDFDFGGRVHTNGDLYLAEGNGATLTFHDKITAHGEIIRQTLVNGLTTSGNYTGTVNVPTAPNGCTTSTSACRALARTEGSLIGGKGSASTPGWDTFALTKYNGNLVHQASQLNLPFVDDGKPIEIIREPLPGEDPTGNLSSSRLYTQAQIRVLLADTQADLPGGPQAGDVSLDTPGTCFASGCIGAANDSKDSEWKRPAGTTGDWSIIGGWLRVEVRKVDSTYQNVTQEWLDLGFSRGLQQPDSEHGRANTEDPNAILIMQQRREDPSKSRGTQLTSGNSSYWWMPLNFYDTREGERRENAVGSSTCSVGGIMTAVELDVSNLRKWLHGDIGTTGTSVESASQNGYILYFADHRGMLADPDPAALIKVKHGDFGYEDFINPNSSSGAADGILDPAEDVNGDGIQQSYGASNLGDAFGVPDGDPTVSVDCSGVGRMNHVSGARHALMIVDGSLGTLPINFNTGGGGFTVASEEPTYVVGNYNASDAAGFGSPHASAAVIADTVTLLSNNWNNEQSMFSPRTASGNEVCPGSSGLANPAGSSPKSSVPPTGRQACSTWYRLAIASGKSINFPHPSGTSNDFGTDGGIHNFLRYLEEWGGQTSHYEGSLVSLYYSQYGVGAFKCCGMVYNPPARNYAFDTDFLDPSKMPPGTPRFVDVVNVDVVQDFTPR